MEQRRTIIITGIILIIIVAVIIAAIVYFIRAIQGRRAVSPEVQNTVITAVSPSPTQSSRFGDETVPLQPESGSGSNSETQIFEGQAFQLTYPASWGVLTCSNSKNFELDPVNNTDQLNVVCDRALKPITVLVEDNLKCQGETITLGGKQVIKSMEGTKGGEADYRYCVITTGPDLDITHRVSQSKAPSSSAQDFSKQIEQMISSMRLGSGS